MNGTWVQISGTLDGKPQFENVVESSYFSFSGNTFQYTSLGEVNSGITQVKGTQTSGSIELDFNKGKAIGRAIYALYKIKDNILYISILKEKNSASSNTKVGVCNCSSEQQFRRHTFTPTPTSQATVSGAIAPSIDGDMLILAIENNDEAKVDELLMQKISPNSRGFKNVYISPLKLAASKGNKNIVADLIKSGADVTEKWVIYASLTSVEILDLVITNGADVNKTFGGNSPLHDATKLELLDSADLLLKHGANINDQNNMFKRTPLQNATQYEKDQSVKWLLEKGANVNLTDSSGQTAFTIGASYKANAKILQMLMDYGAKLPSLQEIQKITQGACRARNLDALEFLTSKGVSLDFNACYTALAYIPSPSHDVLKWLTSRSKIKNIQVEKESMLHIAVENNSLEIAKLLIASGADVNLEGDNGRPPLDGAIWHEYEPTKKADYKEMITLLASHGADFNIKYDPRKTTALHELVNNIDCGVSEEILKARCKTLSETAELLIASGADVNAFDINSNTPLHFAAISNSIVLIELLVNHGADLKFTNSMGQTPLMLSIARGYWGNTINRELLTIKTLVSLENKTGGAPDWTGLREEANKVHNSREKQQILTLLERLEKTPL